MPVYDDTMLEYSWSIDPPDSSNNADSYRPCCKSHESMQICIAEAFLSVKPGCVFCDTIVS